MKALWLRKDSRIDGLGTIASSRLPLVEAMVSFQKLRKVSFGK